MEINSKDEKWIKIAIWFLWCWYLVKINNKQINILFNIKYYYWLNYICLFNWIKFICISNILYRYQF